MELKEGMYVRFTNLNKSCQYIGKLENINECRDPRVKNAVHVNWIDDYVFIGDNDIIKASFNIIDLIEAGDYVNGSRVMHKISNGEDISFPYEHVEVEEDEDIDYERNVICYKNEDIKDVVTKERFNSIKYEVGE